MTTSPDPLQSILAEMLLYLDDRDPTAQFDAIAEKFYVETGFMRPGKSSPLEMYISADQDERRLEAWRQWCEAWRLALIIRIEALAPLSAPSAWQPIETLPESEDFIIGAWPCSGSPTGFDVGEVERDGDTWMNLTGRCQPTHWMPLPPAPDQGRT